MVNQIRNFGELDLYKLLEENNGSVILQLIDAGMIRQKTEIYEFSIKSSDNRQLFLVPKSKKSHQPIEIPSKIVISPELLIFFGMYDGDGNKTGNIVI